MNLEELMSVTCNNSGLNSLRLIFKYLKIRGGCFLKSCSTCFDIKKIFTSLFRRNAMTFDFLEAQNGEKTEI